MKNLLALLAVVALVGVSFAQDLDCPKTGTAAQAQQAQQGGGGSLFDQIMARVMEQEQRYIARLTWEGSWSQYLAAARLLDWGSNYQFDGRWMTDSLAFQQRDQMTAAEFAAFQGAVRESWNRVLAAGLN